MNRTPFVVLLLAAGVTLAGAAEPAQNPPPEKKPAAAPATAPKKETRPPATPAKTSAAAPRTEAAASKSPAPKTPSAAPKPAGASKSPAPAPRTPLAADPRDKDAEPQANTDLKAAEPQAETKKDDPNLGMSILGNQEAPKALVIVPWKSSEIGQGMGIQTLLDDSRQPIDKDVFMRVLNYFELRTTTTPTHAHQNGAKGGKS